jgi:hypothetical protein
MIGGLDFFACLHKKKAKSHRHKTQDKHSGKPDLDWHFHRHASFLMVKIQNTLMAGGTVESRLLEGAEHLVGRDPGDV